MFSLICVFTHPARGLLSSPATQLMLVPWAPVLCHQNNPLTSWPSSPPRTAPCRGAGPSVPQWTSPALKIAHSKIIPMCCGCCPADTVLQSEKCKMIFYCFIWYQPLWKIGQSSEYICAFPASQIKWKSGHLQTKNSPKVKGDFQQELSAERTEIWGGYRSLSESIHSHNKQQHTLKDESCPECLKHWLSYCFSAGKAPFWYHSSYLSLPDIHQHSEFS